MQYNNVNGAGCLNTQFSWSVKFLSHITQDQMMRPPTVRQNVMLHVQNESDPSDILSHCYFESPSPFCTLSNTFQVNAGTVCTG